MVIHDLDDDGGTPILGNLDIQYCKSYMLTHPITIAYQIHLQRLGCCGLKPSNLGSLGSGAYLLGVVNPRIKRLCSPVPTDEANRETH